MEPRPDDRIDSPTDLSRGHEVTGKPDAPRNTGRTFLTDVCKRLASTAWRFRLIRSRLTREGRFDERRQRALTRYYVASGVGGVAVGVHTTQFAIRDPQMGLLELVLRFAAEGARAAAVARSTIGGICRPTEQALREAELASNSATTRDC